MRYHARPMKRPSLLREAVEIVCFFVALVAIVAAMSVTP